MDPLSIAASIAGLVALAGSTASIINMVFGELGSRPAVLHGIAEEIAVLCSILGQVEKTGSSHGASLMGDAKADISSAVGNCMVTFQKIGALLSRMRPKRTTTTKAALQIQWLGKMREMTVLRNDLERHKATLLIALYTLQRDESLRSSQEQTTSLTKLEGAVEELKKALVTSGNHLTIDTQRMDVIQQVLAPMSRQSRIPPSTPSKPAVVAPQSLDTAPSQSSSGGEIITSHNTFDDWLSTFAAEGTQDSEQSSLKQFQLRKKTQSAAQEARGAGPALPSASGHVSSLLVRPQSIQNTGNSEILRNGPVWLVIRDLQKPGSTGSFTEKIQTTLTTSLYTVILNLLKKGYHQVCGFRDHELDRLVFPPFTPYSALSPVTITAGESCYDIPAGLRINQNQRLIDFYNEFLRIIRKVEPRIQPIIKRHESMIELDDPIRKNNGYISFKRTLRVPEDGKSYPLPAFFDSFQLRDVSNFVDKLPGDMTRKGGLFFSMFQREALALSLDGTTTAPGKREDLFAIKIYAGSVNCLSGRTASVSSAHDQEQDYIVCPRQIRLDGFRSTAGEVKQFVAMPLGWDYTIEKQATGSEYIGGLQIQIAPRLSDDFEFLGPLNELGESTISLDKFRSPRDLGIAAGQALLMRDLLSASGDIEFKGDSNRGLARSIYERRRHQCRPVFVSDIVQRYSAVSGSDRTFLLRPVPPIKIAMDWEAIGIRNRGPIEEYSPFLDVGSFRSQVDAIKREVEKLRKHWDIVFNGTCITDSPNGAYHSIQDLGMSNGTVYFQIPPRSKWDGVLLGGLPHTSAAERAAKEAQRTAGWEMGLGVGGKLNQKVSRDTDDRLWDWKSSCLVNIQILNSVAFKSVTGLVPWSPISFKHYVDSAIPFYSFFSADDISSEGSKRPLRSVGTIDIETHGEIPLGLQIRQRGVVRCANCEVNLADTVLLECRHVWCSDCIQIDMSSAGEITCAFCEVVAMDFFQFSAPMEVPREYPLVENSELAMVIEEKYQNITNPMGLDVESLCQKLSKTAISNYVRHTKDSQHLTLDDIVKAARETMVEDGNAAFSVLCALLNEAHPIKRLDLINRIIWEAVNISKPKYLTMMLAFISDASDFELGRGKGFDSLLQSASSTPDDGCVLTFVDWAAGRSLSAKELPVPISELLRVETPESLRHVVAYLTSGGASLAEDLGVTVFDAMNRGTAHVVEKTRILMEHGCDINGRDPQGRTLVYSFRHPETLQGLVDLGLRLDLLDNKGDALIHYTVAEGRGGVFEWLLSHHQGMEMVNMRNGGGLTPYHLTLSWNYWMYLTLVKAGADTTVSIPHGPFRDKLEKWLKGDVRAMGERWVQPIRDALDR